MAIISQRFVANFTKAVLKNSLACQEEYPYSSYKYYLICVGILSQTERAKGWKVSLHLTYKFLNIKDNLLQRCLKISSFEHSALELLYT